MSHLATQALERIEPTTSFLSGLSIVVPVFNEEVTLAEVVESALEAAALLAGDHEIIIVDDGSKDDSGRIAASLAERHAEVKVITHEVNQGFGAAQRTGIESAKFEFVTVIPSDGQFDVRDLQSLAAEADDADIVIGYRENRGDGLYRTLKTKVFGLVMRSVFGVGFRDVNWVKLYRREIFQTIQIASDGIGVEAEIIVKAMRQGLRLKEVKVDYLPRRAGVAKGDQPKSVLVTIKELVRLLLGRM